VEKREEDIRTLLQVHVVPAMMSIWAWPSFRQSFSVRDFCIPFLSFSRGWPAGLARRIQVSRRRRKAAEKHGGDIRTLLQVHVVPAMVLIWA
jgi:hypothetical protein